ncbi:hypothetical protein Aoki45_04590 [Algoriphagus sp. oki45]|uniref:glycosyltransferase family protein n=1 Tax=Algoriphagus sp. oki45 TaxID=3067294 RepID=UPI00280020C1|nr:hypothetical protein Aoki45_04590 [Algoriphagus sp. oki45]
MSDNPAPRIPVLIASTLKPIQDPRAFGKLALSLGETNKYQINIIGFSSKKLKNTIDFRFFSSMGDSSFWSRIGSQIRLFRCLIKIKPKLVVCCTWEFLPVLSLFKSILGFKLVYDVQENYISNLDLNPELNEKQKRKRAFWIGWAEKKAKVDLYLLAEKCYQEEMPEKWPFLVLENKFQGKSYNSAPKDFKTRTEFRFCLTGTLTPAFGTVQAIRWFQEIQKVYPKSRLSVIGHAPVPEFFQKLKGIEKESHGMDWMISQTPIPHEQLINTIAAADFSLLPYSLHAAIADKMPSKLFECAALGTPVLITPNPKWENFLAPFKGGFGIDFSDLMQAVPMFQQAIRQTYFSTPAPGDVLWDSQKSDFQQAIDQLLS